MGPKRVSSGIFIDAGCQGIIQIDAGYFIPESTAINEEDTEYKADLNAFFLKWFSVSGNETDFNN